MSRRILHIADSLDRTGTAKQLLLLGDGLARQGFQVHVAVLDRGGPWTEKFAAVEVGVTILGRRFPCDPVACWRLKWLLDRFCPDIVHTWSRSASFYAAAALATGGLLPANSPRSPRLIAGQYRIDRYRRPLPWGIERWLRRHADWFVSNSRSVRDWCIANGLPAERFAVIPNAAPPQPPSESSRPELLRELRLPNDARLIGVVGQLTPEKRVRDLIWAADLLRVLHDNLRLLIFGDGPLRDELERYARLASDLDHIRFLGERGDIPRIMPHLDVLWNGSDNAAPATAILEALAVGVPVVASDVPVNRELVLPGETGFLIPIGSRAGRAARARATDQIFTNRDLVSRLATNSRERAASAFGIASMIARYTSLYEMSGSATRCRP